MSPQVYRHTLRTVMQHLHIHSHSLAHTGHTYAHSDTHSQSCLLTRVHISALSTHSYMCTLQLCALMHSLVSAHLLTHTLMLFGHSCALSCSKAQAFLYTLTHTRIQTPMKTHSNKLTGARREINEWVGPHPWSHVASLSPSCRRCNQAV